MDITIRHAEPDDAEAIHRIMSGPRAVRATLPLQPAEKRRRWLREISGGTHVLVACVDGEVVGNLGLEAFTAPRLRHACRLGTAVRDDW